MLSWFDIEKLPIPLGQEIGIDGEVRTTSAALRDPPMLDAAVSAVHAMLKQAESMGYESTRIVLGGFGQGAALALLAGRSYSNPLGGIVCSRGWQLRQRTYTPTGGPNYQTPIMLCHGTRDEVVPITCMTESFDLLMRCGANVTCRQYEGEGHNACRAELDHLRHFLARVVPKVEPQVVLEEVAPPPKAQSKSIIRIGGRAVPPPVGEVSDGVVCGPRTQKQTQSLQAPYEFSVHESDGALRVVVRLPGVDTMDKLDLRLDTRGMFLQVVTDGEFLPPLVISWPKAVDADLARAKFSKRACELTVTLPVAPEPAFQAAPPLWHGGL
jgi:HSP20 family molecular chaperone IbpA